MKKSVLITGPIGESGGREIEAGYMTAALLNSNIKVQILSTAYLTYDSQIASCVPNKIISSINKELYKNYFLIQIISVLAWFKNFFKLKPYAYAGNKVSKRFFNYEDKVDVILKKSISEADAVIFLGQLSSNYCEKIIDLTKSLGKKYFFRTTGKIEPNQKFNSYLKNVTAFLHHSNQNLMPEILDLNPNYKILDQTAIDEEKFLQIPILERPVRRFILVGDVSEHKGTNTVLEYFKRVNKLNDEIYILGDGELRGKLENKYEGDENIIFMGKRPHSELASILDKMDCLIIGSKSETGPYVGIEAMAGGRVILSTRVGAMENRLKNTQNDFWFERDNFNSFENQFIRLKNLKRNEIRAISYRNRQKYLNCYSNKVLTKSLIQIITS